MFLKETIKETMPMMNMNSFNTRQQNHFEYFTYIGSTRQSQVATSANTSQGQGGPIAQTNNNKQHVNNPHQHHTKNTAQNTQAVDEVEEGEMEEGSHCEMFVEIV